MDLIGHFYNLFNKRNKITTDNNSNNPFMLQRFCIHYGFCRNDVIELNKFLGKIPSFFGECIMFHCIKKKIGYIKFLYKRSKNNKPTELEEKVMEYLKCSLWRAREYIRIYQREGVDLKKYFGIK